MINYIQAGKILTLTAPYTVASGAGALVGTIFGVATGAVTISTSGEFMTEGVFDLAKDTSVFAQGDKVYWDNTNKVVTSTAAGNTRIGRAVLAALTGAATGRVLLDETGVVTTGSGVVAFQSTEQTGTGSAQSIAHGLAAVPRFVVVFPTDTSPSTAGVFVVTLGAHTTTNVVVTVTTSKKYMVVAFA